MKSVKKDIGSVSTTTASQKNKRMTQSQRLRELQNEQSKQKRQYEKSRKKLHKATTAQKTIRYEQMFEDGICNVDDNIFSMTIRISDINYQSAKKDDQYGIFNRYCEILNGFDPDMPFQLTIINRKLDEAAFRRSVLLPEADDSLNKYRREMNDMLLEKVVKGQNSIIQEKYVTFSGVYQNYFDAGVGLSRLENDISQSFKDLGCMVTSCSGKDRLRIIHDMLRPNDDFTLEYKNLLENGLTTKDYVCPMYFDFSDKSSFEYDGVVAQTLILRDLPTDLSDQIITRLTEKPINMSINLHLHSVPQADALELINKKIMFMDKQKSDEIKKMQKKYHGVYDDSMLSHEVRSNLDQAIQLREDLENNGQSMFKGTLIICVWANNAAELSENVMTVVSAAKSLNCQLGFLEYRQEEGLNSSLPLGRNFVPIERTLTTASAAVFVPFTNQELLDPRGIYYGTSLKSNNLVVLDRTALKASNGLYLGTTGSGKSFAAKMEMISVLLSRPNDEVIIIDPEREYSGLATGFDGTVIKISAAGETHVNPLDFNLNYADNDDPLALKSEFILSVVELILGANAGIEDSGHFRSIVDRALKITYEPFVNSGYDPKLMPTLKDFYRVLKEQPEEEASDIALSLEVYITGTLDIFAQKTNVNFDKRLIVYDLKDLGNQLKNLGMMIILDNIWNRITVNRNKKRRTWIYIDEMQLLLSQEACAKYFFELWSRARKWGAVPTGITQNVETLLDNDIARKMISNSDFILLMNQNASDRIALQNLLNLSDVQMSAVHNSPAGQGLLYSSKGIIPFINKFPVNTEIYKMITTKFGEAT